jgi:hypothetical protein
MKTLWREVDRKGFYHLFWIPLSPRSLPQWGERAERGVFGRYFGAISHQFSGDKETIPD